MSIYFVEEKIEGEWVTQPGYGVMVNTTDVVIMKERIKPPEQDRFRIMEYIPKPALGEALDAVEKIIRNRANRAISADARMAYDIAADEIAERAR